MSKNTIKIRGDLLKKRLEITTGKTLYELSEENGFSRNFLSEACRSGRASPIVQTVVKKYGIDIRSVIFSEVKKEFKQMTIEEIGSDLVPKEHLDNLANFVDVKTDDFTREVNKLGEEMTKLFNDFVEAWNKSIKEYEAKIEEIKKGL